MNVEYIMLSIDSVIEDGLIRNISAKETLFLWIWQLILDLLMHDLFGLLGSQTI